MTRKRKIDPLPVPLCATLFERILVEEGGEKKSKKSNKVRDERGNSVSISCQTKEEGERERGYIFDRKR